MFRSLRRIRHSAILVLSVALAACASFETSESKLRSIRTVGIVSAVGDEFNVTRAGLTGLNSDDRRYAIASWDIDGLIVRQSEAALSRRFQIEPLTYQRDAFANPGKRSPFAPINLVREDALKALLRNQLSSQPRDAYIVIVKAKSSIGPSNRTVEGIGAVAYDAVLGSSHQLHALYEIEVVDGHSFDVIEARAAAPLDEVGLERLAGPSRLVDASLMPSAGDVARNDVLRESITDLIERSLPRTLRDLRLTDDD